MSSSFKPTPLHAIAFSLIAGLAGYVYLQVKTTTTPPSTPSNTTSAQSSISSTSSEGVPSVPTAVSLLKDLSAKARVQHTRCLNLVLKEDPEGPALLDLFNEHTGYALISGPEQLAFDLTEANTKQVMIVVSSRRERTLNRFPAGANWFYEDARRAIYAPPLADYSDLWTGVRLAQQLMFARDYLAGSVPRNPTDDQLQAEGLHANRFEAHLLDHWTKGEYLKQIDAWLASEAQTPDAPTAWYRKPDEALYQSLQKLFPESLSRDESASRHGSLIATLNFRLGEKKGLSDAVIANSMNASLFHSHN